MNQQPDSETSVLLAAVARGEETAVDKLLALHRSRLTQMVEMRMDRKIRARFDASDVVQEALVVATARLRQYSEQRPIPFYPWIRRIAWEQLMKLHEKHVGAAKRSVKRERQLALPVSDESVRELADRLAVAQSTPVDRAVREEMRQRTLQALEQLNPIDREVLELKFLEQMDNEEIAAVLGISRPAARTRSFRALTRMTALLKSDCD